VLLSALWLLLVLTFVSNHSYKDTQYPDNYAVVANSRRKGGWVNPRELWRGKSGEKASESERGNVTGEKIFIVANIIYAHFINGVWGNAVMELMDFIGGENVFLSLYLPIIPESWGALESVQPLDFVSFLKRNFLKTIPEPEDKAALTDLDKLIRRKYS